MHRHNVRTLSDLHGHFQFCSYICRFCSYCHCICSLIASMHKWYMYRVRSCSRLCLDTMSAQMMICSDIWVICTENVRCPTVISSSDIIILYMYVYLWVKGFAQSTDILTLFLFSNNNTCVLFQRFTGRWPNTMKRAASLKT